MIVRMVPTSAEVLRARTTTSRRRVRRKKPGDAGPDGAEGPADVSDVVTPPCYPKMQNGTASVRDKAPTATSESHAFADGRPARDDLFLGSHRDHPPAERLVLLARLDEVLVEIDLEDLRPAAADEVRLAR